MFKTLPELMDAYPLNVAVKGLVPHEKFIITGYLYNGESWFPMVDWLGRWYTLDQIVEEFLRR
jgi:hypothetical protein